MKKAELEMEDNLQDEYDLKSMRVRRLGSGRESFGGSMVRLENDVAEIFPNAEAVNEALRFLIRVMKKNDLLTFATKPNTALDRTEEKTSA
ncbi:MAG: hypothetical protein NW214_12200 [Pseudanabaenaceae cyanobacterium bins.39]|nr:hypothetical protein [Pseudanabaenaceae cyanobacterium bins.39]